MPQAYVALYDDMSHMMIVKKRIMNRFWHGAVGVADTVVNQAGQWALPGGRMNHGEAASTAAEREFLEETGVNLRHYAGAGDVVVNADPDYYVVGYEVASARLTAIQLAVNANLQPNPANANQPTGGGIQDWELAEARIVDTSQLADYLGRAMYIIPAHRGAIAARPANSQAIDWYAQIALALQGH